MKNYFLPLLLLICHLTFSQDLIAVQNGGTPRFFETFDDAYASAVDGDSLFFPGRSYSLSATMNKRLHLIGTGIYDDFNQTTGKTILTPLIIGTGASDSSITGVFIDGNNKSIDFNGQIEGFLIDRCHFKGYIHLENNNSRIKNLVVLRSIIRFIDFENGAANDVSGLISNSIITDRFNYLYNFDILNNVFLGVGAGLASNLTCTDCKVSSNFFKPNQSNWVSVNGGTVQKNINLSNTRNNYFGNYDDSVSATAVFESPFTSSIDTVTFNFNLQSNSPYQNAGADGGAIGIYGGRFPWKDGGEPFNPQVISSNIGGTTDQNGMLPINIQIQAQGN